MTASSCPPWGSPDPGERVAELLQLYRNPQAGVAYLLCDSHPSEAIAATIVNPDLSQSALTYGQLRDASARFAACLAGLGVGVGDRVATLMGKSQECLIALMGIWRLGAVHVPLFTAFAPAAIAMRLHDSRAKVLVCDDAQRSKLEPGDDMPERPPWRVVVAERQGALATGELDFADLLASSGTVVTTAVLGGEAPIIEIYTSGTTGRPKPVVVPTWALAAFRTYLEIALDVRRDDVYWCAGDPGWAYGLYFGILGSLSLGVPLLFLHANFSPEVMFSVLEKYRVTNFAAAPTVYRAMRASDVTAPKPLYLRCASSAGEPLTPEVNGWAVRTLGVAVHDHYGQTETGMVINNHHHPALAHPIKAGSMGRPMPGWSVHVLHEDRDEIAPPGTLGRIAIDIGASPLAWFPGYQGNPAKSAEKFSADRRWYITGDIGRIDDDGDFHFAARDDDVIIMAGYRIGPFEVESVLTMHPAVVDAAAIAVPDSVRGEILEAYVVLRNGQTGTPELAAELQQLVKDKLAAHAYPRTVHFADELPKTPSGKVQRFRLREQRRAELDSASR